MNNQEIISQLRLFASGKLTPGDAGCGLCFWLASQERRDLENLLRNVIDQWPLFSGNTTFPVPHNTEGPSTAYIQCEKWSLHTHYGKNRRALCKWFADYLEQHQEKL